MDYEKLPESVLRIEMHCERSYLRDIQKEENIENTMELLTLMVKESEKRIIKQFSLCFRTCTFRRIEEIEKRIRAASFHEKKKKQMLKLSRCMQRKQNLDKELKCMAEDGVDTDKLLDAFQKIDTNPVPLRKSFVAPCLPGPVELLRGIAGGNMPVEYMQIKSR